jgi:hypothetical protein
MPAKWQQWMPFKIDAFRGSPSVQAMHPCARIGYLYLLASAWQTDDCTIPSDPIELADKSGLGDDLWAQYGPRILRKFEPIEGNGRQRNSVCYQEWLDAKRVYDKRRDAADRTNSARSPSENGTVTAREPLRLADTQTTVVSVSVPSPSSLRIPKSQIETLYRLYPRKIGKEDAFRAIEKALKKKPFDDLLLAVEKFRKRLARDGIETQFIPYPASWFNKGHYEDEDDGGKTKNQGSTPHSDDSPRIKTGSAYFDSLLEPIVEGD